MPACNRTTFLLRCLSLPALLLTATASFGQAAQIGFPPTDLAGAPFEFPTAEQDGIRVEVVATGFGRAFSLALLPNGDALISERGVGLRLVRNATGGRGAPALDLSGFVGDLDCWQANNQTRARNHGLFPHRVHGGRLPR